MVDRPRPPRPRRRLALGAGAALVAGVLALSLVGTTTGTPDRVAATDDGELAAPPSTEACVDLPYQPCGEPVAPNTDGRACLGATADYDGDPRTGCEAEPDALDGTELVDRLEANLVPADDIDRYDMVVEDRFQLLCDGTLEVTLTAPAGVSMRLDVLDSGQILGSATSSDGRPASVRLQEPSCGGDDSTVLQARVSWAGEARSAEPYVLARTGSW